MVSLKEVFYEAAHIALVLEAKQAIWYGKPQNQALIKLAQTITQTARKIDAGFPPAED